MGNTNGGKFPRVLYNFNKVRSRSGQKDKKAIEWYIDLLKKEEKEGTTKWIYKTKIKAEARLKKFGISFQTIAKRLEKKGLQTLATKVQK